MDFRIELLKVLIAVGWSDGELSEPERALLRGWMTEFHLSEQQRNYLQYYLDHPTTREQAEVFSRTLVEAVQSPQQREEALVRLEQLARADDQVDVAEQDFLSRIRDLFTDTGNLGLFANRFKQFFAMRPFGSGGSGDALLAQLEAELLKVWRERDHQDPDVAELKAGGALSTHQRSLMFVGALGGCTWAELGKPLPPAANCIQTSLGLDEVPSRFVEQFLSDPYVRSLDRSRLVRGVEEYAERGLAQGLIDLLFCLAARDGEISEDEVETIRGVALGLKITHRVFIASKLRHIPQTQS
ncbi:MAG: TerB family tellurite resistance protein [Gemmatimonadaceae bacterium]|nr:TerB family tellurite resistance protein [Gloeobacterales cyanobacterium ES-bin-141]